MEKEDRQKLVRPKVTKTLYVVSALVLLNIIISAYLLYEFYFPNGSSFCAINSTFNCIDVAKSEYAILFGLPIALWGAVFYLALFIGVLGVALNAPFWKIHKSIRPGRVLNLTRYLAYFGLLFSLYLTYVEFFVIYVICPLCLVQQILIIAIVALLIRTNNIINKGLKETKVCEFC